MVNHPNPSIPDAIRETMKKYACDRTTAEEILNNEIAETQIAQQNWLKNKPALIQKARIAYHPAQAEYLRKNPEGKNSDNAGIRAARQVYPQFERKMA